MSGISGKIKKIVNPASYKRAFKYVREHGFSGFFGKVKRAMNDPIPDELYNEWFKRNKAGEEVLARQREHVFEYSPLISILVPTYNTPEEFLKDMIDSVIAQSYSNWELCIADGSDNGTTRDIIDRYVEKDERIHVVKLDKNYGISGNTNKALELSKGDFIGLLDHDDTVEPDLLYEIVTTLQDKNVYMVYTDEDKIVKPNKNKQLFTNSNPIFKPDFSPDLLRSHNYITHFTVIKSDVVKEVGGFDSKYDGSQDYDLFLKSIEKIQERKGRIEHVPRILYHWRMTENSTAENPESKLYCYEAGRTAIEDHLKRLGISAKVEYTDMWGLYHVIYEPVDSPLLSIIIPNKDHIEDLDKCISSIEEKSSYRNFEIIVVENNSENDATFKYYDELKSKYDNVKVVVWEKEFNYSAINNYGVKYAEGDYLLLLNNDTELINEDAFSDMLGILMREDVGIVGAKLLYADDTIQHAGIVLGFAGYAGHVFHGLPKDDLGYMMRPRINCNYSAVTGACLMTKKAVFDLVGGLTEELPVAGNDVDYCLKVRQKDYLVVYDAFALLHHYESKSRGYEDTPEKKARFEREVEQFRKYWGDVIDAGDPYYNKNFPVTIAPFTLE